MLNINIGVSIHPNIHIYVRPLSTEHWSSLNNLCRCSNLQRFFFQFVFFFKSILFANRSMCLTPRAHYSAIPLVTLLVLPCLDMWEHVTLVRVL